MRIPMTSLIALFVAAILTACVDPALDDEAGDEPSPVTVPDPDDADDPADGVDGPADGPDGPNGADGPDDGADGPDDGGSGDGFDRDTLTEQAEALLGLSEQDVQYNWFTRIVRRGNEHSDLEMDIRPGRKNVEVDEVGGTMIVTRVVVEAPDDGAPIVVELNR